ncbi:class I SAM-dependent methyltransferase [Pseudonocardia sp. TRM90224]|uniref:class I SAM-dependent methyltransferase n=1 Tax=Pseudonocardia sp. TRM90224 TaxID=2812678 RepID=UPI001E593BA3|nr:class I SAM-dependent methyltransferase [Pseudonocardia sp. TRM90224]
MDGPEPDRWSAVADVWDELWGRFAEPAWAVVLEAAGVGAGSRVLDVGCGSGNFLAFAAAAGAEVAGVDPAPHMVRLARARVPGADIREGTAEPLPWPDGTFDLVTAFNALQFAEDTFDALAEFGRVARPAGLVAIVNWAEAARNDLDTIEAAVAAAAGEEVRPGGELREPGGLEGVLREAGFEVVAAGLVEVPWAVADDETLVRGVLMGEDDEGIAAAAPAVVAAAEPFRTADGGYRTVNAFRFAVGRTPAA